MTNKNVLNALNILNYDNKARHNNKQRHLLHETIMKQSSNNL